jgi:hypothetical protein
VIGGTIVITGTGFRVAEFRAVIGPSRMSLPVRTATSTSTRIELDVPESVLGRTGELLIGYPMTQGTVLETNYRIDPPNPTLLDATASGPMVPFQNRSFTVRIREFPGTQVNVDNITFSSTCQFRKRRATTFGTATRDPDLTMRISVQGWFQQSGNCPLQLSMQALTSAGTSAGGVQVTANYSVNAATLYTFGFTSRVMPRLNARLVHNGLANVCQAETGDWPGGQRVGVHDVGGDYGVIVRGALIDVNCDFRTEAWQLPPGVRLQEIQFSRSSVGNRCGSDGNFSATLPSINPSFTRGAVVVRPAASQTASDFAITSDNEVIFDGVTYASNLREPTTVILPMFIGMECISMATFLTTSSGTHGPTTDPQSFTVRLDRMVFSGPPGLTAEDIIR